MAIKPCGRDGCPGVAVNDHEFCSITCQGIHIQRDRTLTHLERLELAGKDTNDCLKLIEALDALEAAQSDYVRAWFSVSRRGRRAARLLARQEASAEA